MRQTHKGKQTMSNNTYNGWTNKETWLVNIWYGDDLPEYFAEDEDREDVTGDELEEHVRFIAEECEALSQLPAGLLSDFINTCWGEVNWEELAESVTQVMQEIREE